MLVRRGERLRDDPETAGRTGSDNYRWLREKSIVEFRESAIEGFVEKLVSSASMRAVCFEGTQKKREREREREFRCEIVLSGVFSNLESLWTAIVRIRELSTSRKLNQR